MTAHYAYSPRLVLTATEWFHGTGSPTPFSRFDFSKSRSDFDNPSSDTDRLWNSRLGSHFSPEHRVATELAADHGGGHVYHVDLDLKNPKYYASEFDLGKDGHDFARHQLGYSYDELRPPHSGHSAYSEALDDHPHAQYIADEFRKHLQSQGHDGITYGNEYEGAKRHTSAIIFTPDQAKIAHTHGADEPCEHSTACEHCGRLRYPEQGESSCTYCTHGQKNTQEHTASATAFFRTAAVPNGWHQDPDHAHISRGLEIEPDGGWHPDVAHRILSGTATHEDLLHHINADRVGHYWSTHNVSDSNSHYTPRSYAEPREPITNWTRHAEPGENVLGAAGVVLIGHRPHGWNPDDNPDEGLMGNSYLPDHSHIPLHEIHYSGDGENWHRLTPPAGTTVHTDGPAHTATAFFRSTYDALEGGVHGQADDAGAAERGGVRGGDVAQAGDGRRPQPGQPERAAGARRVRAAAAVERHEELQGDLDRLGGGARHVQDTITALQHGQSGVTTYPLSRPLDGWHAAITSGGHQVVHRVDPDTKTLHVGYAGHNMADAEARLGGSGGGEGGALPVEFHKGAEKDFDALHPQVQDRVLDTIDRLSRREPHPHDHALTGPLKGWGAARADFLNRVTHRYEDNEGNPVGAGKATRLFIGHVGPHNYDDAIKRLTSLSALAFFRETASVEEDDYRLQHTAPGPDGDAPLHDLTSTGVLPDDIYTHPHYYSDMSAPSSKQAHQVIKAVRGNPEAPVTIYRALPAEHAHKGIRTGDWVSTSPDYAREHGMMEHEDDDWPVVKATVQAKHLYTNGDDLREYGYHGPHQTTSSIAFSGGRNQTIRATPGGGVEHAAPKQATLEMQAAAVDNSGGVMVAFVPPREIAEQIAQEGGQPVEDLHVTLAYLGNAADYSDDQLQALPRLVSSWAVHQKPVTLRVGGVLKFNNAFKGQHVLGASIDIPGGAQMHASLARFLQDRGYRLPSEHGWTPHMTLRYVNEHFRFMPRLDDHRWEASEVHTVIGGESHPAVFGGRPTTITTL